MLCLPPYTTHKAQPLDCTVFSPFKAKWRTVCHEYFQANPGKVIINFNFVSLFTNLRPSRKLSLLSILQLVLRVVPLHIPKIIVAMTIPLLMVPIALLLNEKNYLRNNMRKAVIYSLMLTMSDGSNYITQTKAFLQMVD